MDLKGFSDVGFETSDDLPFNLQIKSQQNKLHTYDVFFIKVLMII